MEVDMNKVRMASAIAPVELSAPWETYGPRRLKIVGGGDGIRLCIQIDEKELQGYALDKTLGNVRRMLEALREDGRPVDVELIETCRAVRMTSM
jgi:hypothetical protein